MIYIHGADERKRERERERERDKKTERKTKKIYMYKRAYISIYFYFLLSKRTFN